MRREGWAGAVGGLSAGRGAVGWACTTNVGMPSMALPERMAPGSAAQIVEKDSMLKVRSRKRRGRRDWSKSAQYRIEEPFLPLPARVCEEDRAHYTQNSMSLCAR